MSPPPGPDSYAPRPAFPLAAIVAEYQQHGDVGILFDQLKSLSNASSPEALKTAAEPFRDLPEVVIPLYESIVARSTSDAQAMVVLANAYWLTGRGADVVGELAARAISAD